MASSRLAALLLLALPPLISAPHASAQIITTVAGGGPAPGTTATSASVEPMGVAVDANGNVYFTSQADDSVYKLSGGLLTRVAGQGAGAASSGGDGGPATSAQLNLNQSPVAVDSAGNFYFVDADGGRVRAVNTQSTSVTLYGVTIAPGNIATIAGNGQGHTGDGGPATSAEIDAAGIAIDAAGNLYIAEFQYSYIRKVTPGGTISSITGNGTLGYSGDNGPAGSAMVSQPEDVAVDAAGNVYIADTRNYRVRVINTQTASITVFGVTIAPGYIATVAGNGTFGDAGDGSPALQATLYPTAVALDSSGNLYIADSGNNRIRVVDPAGAINAFAGNGGYGYSGDGGPATGAEFEVPPAIATDPSGDLLIADTNNGRLREVNTLGTISTVAGNGTDGYSGDGGQALNAQLEPDGVAISASGNIYIANDFAIRVVNNAGTISTLAGNSIAAFSGDGGPAASAQFDDPAFVALDAGGNLYIADEIDQRIRVINNQSGPVTIAGVTIAPGNIATIAGNGSTGYTGDGGPATSAGLQTPASVAFDPAGNLYIADYTHCAIRVVNLQLTTITVFGVTVAPGNIATVAGNGTCAISGDNGPASAAELYYPDSIALDGNGNLYIAQIANPLRKVSGNGTISSFTGTNAWYVAVDPAGDVYIVPFPQDYVEVLNPQSTPITVLGVTVQPGQVAVVAGSKTNIGFTGDGGPATGALLNVPAGLALDAAGNLYIADLGNHRIRKITQDASTVMVSVGTSPAGLAFTVDGTPYTEPHTFVWNVNDSHTIATDTAQNSTGTENNFVYWSDSGAASHSITVASGVTSYTATFETSYELITSASPSVGGMVTPGSGQYYLSGSMIGLTASPAIGYAFVGWTGTVDQPNSSTANVTMNAPETVTANFALITTLSWSPATAIIYGSSGTNVLDATATPPGTITYTATPNGSSTAVPISNTTTLAPGDYTITATFTPTYPLQNAPATATSSLNVSSESVWIVIPTAGLGELNGQGTPINSGNAPGAGAAVAIDNTGNLWSIGSGPALEETTQVGEWVQTLSSGGGFTSPSALAIDGASQIWVANSDGPVSLFSDAGTPLSPSTGFTDHSLSTPSAVAIDLAGSVWIANSGNNSLTRFLGAAAPVAPPAAANAGNTTGARP